MAGMEPDHLRLHTHRCPLAAKQAALHSWTRCHCCTCRALGKPGTPIYRSDRQQRGSVPADLGSRVGRADPILGIPNMEDVSGSVPTQRHRQAPCALQHSSGPQVPRTTRTTTFNRPTAAEAGNAGKARRVHSGAPWSSARVGRLPATSDRVEVVVLVVLVVPQPPWDVAAYAPPGFSLSCAVVQAAGLTSSLRPR